MLSILGSWILGTLVLAQAIVFTVACCLPIYVLTLVKVLSPRWEWRRSLTTQMTRLTEFWARGITGLFDTLLPTLWEIESPDVLRRDGSYLVIANHQSWVDIVVIFNVLAGRIQFPRFFLKRQLLWMPFMGPVFWALDYPAMRRYSSDYLEKHPEKRGKDLETVRRATRRYRGRPVTIFNFVEGTRFTKEKYAAQDSPYRHLLRPRAGGVAFALTAMGGDIRELVDLTIAFPGGIPGFWEFLSGRVPLVRVRVRVQEVPSEFIGGDYEGDPAYRLACQEAMHVIWERKDRDLDEMLKSSA